MSCQTFLDSLDPRVRSCSRCGISPERHPQHVTPGIRERDHTLELHLMDIAARAAGYFDTDGNGNDGGLSAFADSRAMPGGVRGDIDAVREAGEELADARNYLLWEIERIYEQVIVGEPDALDRYSQLFGALSALIDVHHKLHRIPS